MAPIRDDSKSNRDQPEFAQRYATTPNLVNRSVATEAVPSLAAIYSKRILFTRFQLFLVPNHKLSSASVIGGENRIGDPD